VLLVLFECHFFLRESQALLCGSGNFISVLEMRAICFLNQEVSSIKISYCVVALKYTNQLRTNTKDNYITALTNVDNDQILSLKKVKYMEYFHNTSNIFINLTMYIKLNRIYTVELKHDCEL
jgi:hypothetical protein